MYNLSEIKVVHLEPTRRCQAKCPMCRRRVHGGRLNTNANLTDEISLEDFKKWFPTDFIQQLDRLYMCGNLGDPIIAEESLEIFQYLRLINPKISLLMRTNGSARNDQWWEKLAKIKVKTVFAIDGLEDTHAIYRVNTDWNKIINNAKTFINSGGIAEWAMLVFKHNEHQVEACRQMAEELRFKTFSPRHTARFQDNKYDVFDENNNVLYSLYPTDYSNKITTTIKKSHDLDRIESPTINCKVEKRKSMFVAANGKVTPCCWTSMDSRKINDEDLVEYQDRVHDPLSLRNFSLKEIFDTQFQFKIKDTWCNSPLKICSKNCGRISPCEVQHIEKRPLPEINE